MKTWFTADYHLNHANIIKYCQRPFTDVEDMNTTIIRNHNERIKKDDTVFFLGDFCFRNSPGGKVGEGKTEKASFFLAQLNGDIIKIKGNHDRNNSLKTCIERVIIRYGGHRICLDPIHVDVRYPINFIGHVHEKWKFRRMRIGEDFTDVINVGVDVWNFKPVTFEEVMKSLKQWKKNKQNLNSQE